MNNWLPYKTKQFFFVLIKLSIVTGAFYFIFNKLVNTPELNFSAFVDFLSKNNIFSPKNICFLLGLTFFNWFFEILKWQQLVSTFKKITFKNALEQSLGSLTASLFTPNRIGEYGAKAMYYYSHHRKKIVFINLLGNMIQMFITTIFGIIGLSFFASQYNIGIDHIKLISLMIIVLIVIICLTLAIKNSTFTIRGISIEKIKIFIINFSRKAFLKTFFLSMLRYGVFSFQFYLLLYFFKVNISYADAMILISSMYLLSSIVPSIFILDVVIKGSVALYLFSFVSINEFVILSITTIMWLLNFVLPSIFGSYYVLNFNLPKTNN